MRQPFGAFTLSVKVAQDKLSTAFGGYGVESFRPHGITLLKRGLLRHHLLDT